MDLTKQLQSVQRVVEKTTVPSGEGRTVRFAQTFPTNIDTLWEACTNADLIKKWFSPVTGDLKLGGTYQVEGNAGGTIEKCDKPHYFRLTWEMGGYTSWLDVRLTAVDDNAATDTEEGGSKCRFEVAHLMAMSSHWEKYGAGATGVGWDMSLAGLAAYVDGITIDPTWLEGDEFRSFLTSCSEKWGDAAMEAGESAEEAKARAEATTAFYVPPRA